MKLNTENNIIDDSFDLDLKKARDGLQGHVLSLSQYAEETLAELKNAARELKKRALAQAEVEAGAIIARVEKEAGELLATEQVEIRTLLEKETATIRAGVQQVGQLYDGLTSQLANIME